jgi:peptidylprolyl isomerase
MKSSLPALLAAVLTMAGSSTVAAPTAPPAPMAAPEVQPTAADWLKLDPENVLVIDTTKGRIFVEMTPEIAPESVARIKQLTREHFYDGLKFHRVVDKFMAQTGDPLGTGEGGSKYPNVKAEFTFRRDAAVPFNAIASDGSFAAGFVGAAPIVTQSDALMDLTADHKVAAWARFCAGSAGMARAGDPNSANSQFYLMRQTYPSLDRSYTVWGRVVSGLSVVRALNVGEPVPNPDLMTKVQILADMPAGQRPTVLVLDPKSAAFTALVEKTKLDKGSDFSVCDVEVPSLVK